MIILTSFDKINVRRHWIRVPAEYFIYLHSSGWRARNEIKYRQDTGRGRTQAEMKGSRKKEAKATLRVGLILNKGARSQERKIRCVTANERVKFPLYLRSNRGKTRAREECQWRFDWYPMKKKSITSRSR